MYCDHFRSFLGKVLVSQACNFNYRIVLFNLPSCQASSNGWINMRFSGWMDVWMDERAKKRVGDRRITKLKLSGLVQVLF